MTPEQRARKQAAQRKRVANMTPDQRELLRARNRERNRTVNMTPEQRERKRARERARIANMTPEQLEQRRARDRDRHRIVNMPPERLEWHREWRRAAERRQVSNMSPEQQERRRARHRMPNMSTEQIVKKRERRLRHLYRITAEQRDALAIAQGCACACCGDVARLVVDHDHTTGRLRALLCNSCNCAIGFLRDDPERAIAAAEYLAKHQRPILALVA